MSPASTIAGLRRQDWASVATILCAIDAVAAALRGDGLRAAAAAIGAVVAAGLARRWSRLHPGPMPYALKWTLHLSHPGLGPHALHRMLAPRAGERLLEIGPGIGYHALPTAAVVGPRGRLDVLDVQPAMLAELGRRAAHRGVTNVVATAGDAERLPYPSATFDGAYLVTVLGEIPHPEAALRELARVVKPGGRIVTGELVIDPDYVAPERLQRLADAAGVVVAGRTGTRLAYFARLDVPQLASGARPSGARPAPRSP